MITRRKGGEMIRRSLLAWGAIAAMGLALAAGDAVAQSAKDLVGTWTVVSAPGIGPNPAGMVMFDGNGRFLQLLLRPDLPKYASNNRMEGTPEENKATIQGSIGFFGTYTVSGTDLIRHIEGSSYPNWTGTDQKLTSLMLTGDELKWTNPAPSGGGSPVLMVWKRAK
jgi:hypothetical protein